MAIGETATVKAYNKYYKIYDKETAFFWRNFPSKILNIFVGYTYGPLVLDLGSGTGRDALLLKKKHLKIVCVDASEKMVNFTRKLGFDSVLCDMRKLDFPKSSFDGIWAYTSLIHLKHKEVKKVLKNIHHILKPNGTLLIGAIKGNYRGYVNRDTMPNAKRYFEYYTDKELDRIVSGNGFKLLYKQHYQPRNTIYLNHIYRKV